MNGSFLDASDLLLRAWFWLPYWIVLDLSLYHLMAWRAARRQR